MRFFFFKEFIIKSLAVISYCGYLNFQFIVALFFLQRMGYKYIENEKKNIYVNDPDQWNFNQIINGESFVVRKQTNIVETVEENLKIYV